MNEIRSILKKWKKLKKNIIIIYINKIEVFVKAYFYYSLTKGTDEATYFGIIIETDKNKLTLGRFEKAIKKIRNKFVKMVIEEKLIFKNGKTITNIKLENIASMFKFDIEKPKRINNSYNVCYEDFKEKLKKQIT